MHSDAPAQPTLLGESRLPTVRDIARWRRDNRAGEAPGPVRRRRGSEYREVACRSALNRVAGMPFAWTLNPYRGCTHGCHFCFARRYQPQLEMDPGNEFSSVILVKVNFPEVLRRELAVRPRPGERAAFGTATDPYQPIEGSYRLTRRALKALVARPMRIDIVTRGPLIVRDTDLLVELSRKVPCTVSFSLPTIDEAAWRRLEPGTAHPRSRLRALRTLAAAGVEAGVLMAPVVPGISSSRARLEATVSAIADNGARFVGTGLLRLEGGARSHFLDFLAGAYPALLPGYRRLYAGKHPDAAYAARIRALLDDLRARHGLARSPSVRNAAEDRTLPSAAPPAWRQQRLGLAGRED